MPEFMKLFLAEPSSPVREVREQVEKLSQQFSAFETALRAIAVSGTPSAPMAAEVLAKFGIVPDWSRDHAAHQKS